MKIHNTKVLKHLAERRRRVAKAMGLRDEILLIGAGEPIPFPEGSDQTYPFFAHPEYYYLTGIDSPGGVLAFDPRQRSSKPWVSFVPYVTQAEKMWEGRTQPSGIPLPRLEPWLGARRGRPIANLGAPLRGVRSDESDVVRTREQFTHVRRAKDEVELVCSDARQRRLRRDSPRFGVTFKRASANEHCRSSSKPNSFAMEPTALVIQQL